MVGHFVTTASVTKTAQRDAFQTAFWWARATLDRFGSRTAERGNLNGRPLITLPAQTPRDTASNRKNATEKAATQLRQGDISIWRKK
jgi:hypothetical protein